MMRREAAEPADAGQRRRRTEDPMTRDAERSRELCFSGGGELDEVAVMRTAGAR